MGAAGRDLHNFLTYFKDNPEYKVVCFTATQIPGIEHRTVPPILTGKLYPDGIPMHPEKELPELIKKYDADQVILAYSDLSRNDVMKKASKVLAYGADFRLMGPKYTMLKSKKPLVSVCATRTGAGKGTISRKVLDILRKRYKPVVIRHPMPYGVLTKQVCQRFANYDDLDANECTIEEREEYTPYIDMGLIVYAGVDYKKILEEAEKEADIIVFEGGNNDFSFFRPDLYITVVDPLRPRGLYSYPGEVNVRMADVIVISKLNAVTDKTIVERLIKKITKMNPKANIIKGDSVISVDKPELVKDKSVLVIEDAPTVTHGALGYSAGYVAANNYKARNIIDPRPYAEGTLKDIFKKFPHIKNVLPSMGYTKEELKDLEITINKAKCDTVVFGTMADLRKIIKINKPVARVSYEFREVEGNLADFLNF